MTERAAPGRTRGLTLIEVLVVVGIIMILASLTLVGMGTATRKAKQKASKALVGRVQTALESYFAEFRDYPPDGYDLETGMAVDTNGVSVGSPARKVKGTASLIYFLCRPLVKISFMGDPADPRSVVKRPSGPFLTLEASNLSRPEHGGREFDPNFPWSANAFWGAPPSGDGMSKCEIIDAYLHPLTYDKVKTYDPAAAPAVRDKYFQAQRFHFYGTVPALTPGGHPHPDQPFLTSMPTTDDDEKLGTPDWPDYTGALSAAATSTHGDPRFAKWYTGNRYSTGAPANPNVANTPPGGTHCPRNVGGFDLWSSGQSWTNTRDDITSWE